MVHIFRLCFLAELFQLRPTRHLGRPRASLHKSPPPASIPARRAKSTDPSVCPARTKHAAIPRSQRVDMPRPQQILWLGIFGDSHLNRCRPILRRDARRHSEFRMRIDRNCKRRPEPGRVQFRLRMKAAADRTLRLSAERHIVPRAWRHDEVHRTPASPSRPE